MIGVNSNTFTIDSERLEKEQENYESWLEERTESVYQIAKIAKSKKVGRVLRSRKTHILGRTRAQWGGTWR